MRKQPREGRRRPATLTGQVAETIGTHRQARARDGRRTIAYLKELQENWRPLLAATFGLGTGSAAITLYTAGILAPHMIEDLGWTRSQFALLGVLSLIPSLCFPIAGRLADLFGVRPTVLIGIVALPVAYFLFSIMTGPVWQYIAIQAISSILAITTTATIYTRIAVQYVERARGLALAIVASGPPALGVFLSLAMSTLIEAEGWRVSYQVLAAYAAVTGVITLLLLPREKPKAQAEARQRRSAREDYPLIMSSPAFWALLFAMLTCNLPQILVMSQMKLVLLELQVGATEIALLLAAVPIGVLAGRFVAGLALDRYPAHIVGFIGLGLPSIGLALVAMGVTTTPALLLAVVCMGFALGAEGDILAYVVARQFGLDIYSSVMGLLTMAISLSVAMGSGILSLTLKLTGKFDTYLWICTVAVLAGSFLVLSLGGRREYAAPAG